MIDIGPGLALGSCWHGLHLGFAESFQCSGFQGKMGLAVVRMQYISCFACVYSTHILIRSVQAEVSRTDQFKGKPGKRKADGDADGIMDEHAYDEEQGNQSDEDDDEPVVKKRPAAKRTKIDDEAASGHADGARGRGRGRGGGRGGRKPGSSAPPKTTKPKAKAAGKKAAKPKADGEGDDAAKPKATGEGDDEPEKEQAKGTTSPGEAGPSKKCPAKAAAKKAVKPKAKCKAKAGDEEPAFKEKVFARRPRPNPPDQAMQWQAIRDIFDSHVKPSLRFPSKHEYAWYDKIKPLFTANSPIDDYLKIARGRASDFVKSVSK